MGVALDHADQTQIVHQMHQIALSGDTVDQRVDMQMEVVDLQLILMLGSVAPTEIVQTGHPTVPSLDTVKRLHNMALEALVAVVGVRMMKKNHLYFNGIYYQI